MRDDQLRDEAVYEQARADRLVWERARAVGLSRRKFLEVAATAAGAAALGLGPLDPRRAGAAHTGRSIVKPTPDTHFRVQGTNAEMRWEAMYDQDYRTPTALFFVRNHTSTPHLDAESWRLRVEGDGVRTPLELTYDDLLGMESVSETRFIECAGNGRSFFETQQGDKRPSGTQWRLGAIGVADWRGVPLSRVLERAGLSDRAVDVMPEGLDAPVGSMGHVRRPLSVEKALAEDTLLVYEMNGEPLPEDHGFPVRLLVPGWIGIANIKWVGRIEVAEQPLQSAWNTQLYRLFGPAYPDAPVLSEQAVKSAFELPWDTRLAAGSWLLKGRSWSAHHKIERVDVSMDGGARWVPATLHQPNVPKAWVRWSVAWEARPGPHVLMARATDKHGHVQPDTVPFNEQGYLFWAVVKHPVTVV